MAPDSTFLGLTRRQQAVGIGVAGLLFALFGLSTSSAVDASYDPLPFGAGLVMVLYALGVFAHDFLFVE